MIDAIVYFTPRNGVTGLLDLALKRGFRHCGVIVFYGSSLVGVQVDPGQARTLVRTWPRPLGSVTFDRELSRMRDEGYIVAEYHSHVIPERTSRFPLCTCVEQVKRILGITGFWIWTPYQLWKHLQEVRNVDA